MATFEAQVEALTGITISSSGTNPTQAELTQFLQDGVLDVTSKWLIGHPQDGELFMRASSLTTSQGFTNNAAKIIVVVREDGVTAGNYRPCKKISPAQQSQVTDTDSLFFASKYHPTYMQNEAGTISVFPAPGASPNGYIVYYVNKDPVNGSGSALAYSHDDIKYFPIDKAYLIALYAAVKSINNNMAAIITDLGTFSPSTVIGDTLTAPSFTYTAAVDDTSIDSTIGAMTDLESLGSAPNYASPTTTISGTAWGTAYPDEYSALNTALAAITTEVGLAKAEVAEIVTQTDGSSDFATALTAMNGELDKADDIIVEASVEFDKSDAILDLGEADSEGAVNTAAAKIITEMDETQGVCDLINTQADSAVAALVKMDAEIVLANAEADLVNPEVDLAKAEILETVTLIDGGIDTAVTAINASVDKVNAEMVKAELEVDKAEVEVDAEDMEKAQGYISTTQGYISLSQGYLSEAQGYVNEVNARVAQVNGQIAVANGYLATASGYGQTGQAYLATAQGYGNEASGYIAASGAFANELQSKLVIANGYIAEINVRLAQAGAKRQESQSRLSTGSAYIQEAQAVIAQAGGYAQEVSARGGFTSAKSQAVQGYIQTAQGYANEVQTLLSQTPVKVSEYQARVQDALNEFNEATVKYQAEIQEHMQESQNEVTRLTTIYSKNTDVNIQNAVNNYRLYVDEYTASLGKYQAEVQAYSAEVNTEVQEQGVKIQTESAKYKWLQDRGAALQAEYIASFGPPQAQAQPQGGGR